MEKQSRPLRIAPVPAAERTGQVRELLDLVTIATEHGHGYGGTLLDWVIAEARRLGCRQFHLDSGTQRHAAHRLYLSRHLRISAFHFSTELT